MSEVDRPPVQLPYDTQPGVMGAERLRPVPMPNSVDPTAHHGYVEALDLVEADVRAPGFGTEASDPATRRTVAAEFAGYLGLTSGYDQKESLGSVEEESWLGDDRFVHNGYGDEEERR